jgi:hypothetical protein
LTDDLGITSRLLSPQAAPPAQSPSASDAGGMGIADRLMGNTQAAPAQKPKDAPRSSGTVAGGILDKFTQGLTFGFGDEITATEAAILGRKPGGGYFDWGNYDQPYSERYDAALAAERGQQGAFSEAYPKTALAAEIAGAVGGAIASGGAGVVSGGATRASQVGRAALGGAAGGATQGFGDGEGGVDRVIGAGVGGGVGAVGGMAAREAALGVQKVFRMIIKSPALFDGKMLTDAGRKALQQAGINPAEVSDEFAQAFAARVKQAGGVTDEVARMAQADEFGIPLTRGQATGDIPQIAFEEASRNAARGTAALTTVQSMDRAARTQTGAAVEDIGRSLGGGIEETATDAAGRVGGFVQKAAVGAKAAVKDAYANPLIGQASIDVRAFDGLPQAAREAIDGLTFNPSPQALGAIRDIEQLVTKATTGPDGAIGVAFDAVEALRKKLNRVQSSDAGVMNEVKAIKGALDRWTQGTMDDALIQGSPEALDAIKAARAKYGFFRGTFTAQRGDDVSRIMEKLAREDTTPREVANALWGTSKVGQQGSSVRLAAKLKTILAPDEWDAVRSGLWQRLAQTSQGEALTPQKLTTRVNEFLNGEGKALAMQMFNEKERATMRRFSDAMKMLVPPSEATNPSKTSYAISRLVSDGWSAMMTSMGMVAGGPVGAVGAKIATAGGGSVKASIKAASIPAPTPLRGPAHISRSGLSGAAPIAAGGQAGNALNEDVPWDGQPLRFTVDRKSN